jgi:glucose-1-phosphate adenylyltransferase
MDYRTLIEFHRARDADITVAVMRLHRDEVRAKLGELIVDDENRVVAFDEKPEEPTGIPGTPEYCLASLGIYAFRTGILSDELQRDAGDSDSNHDFGRNLLPAAIAERKVYAFPFEQGNRNLDVYWRDVGTLDSYWQAHMDLVGVVPRFDLYDRAWPVHTLNRPRPPAKVVRGEGDVAGAAFDSLLSSGSIVSGGTVVRSVLSPGVVVRSGAHVEDSILLDRVEVGRGARIRRAIVDKRVIIPDGAEIGYDRDADGRLYRVTESGVTVVPKGSQRL